jgi:hypothetical protein
VTINIDGARRVSGLLQAPKNAHICYVLAHGAGAGMAHPFMAAVADGLAERGIATLRYQFPYMEQGSKRPDAPKLAQATVRAAVAEAAHLLPGPKRDRWVQSRGLVTRSDKGFYVENAAFAGHHARRSTLRSASDAVDGSPTGT